MALPTNGLDEPAGLGEGVSGWELGLLFSPHGPLVGTREVLKLDNPLGQLPVFLLPGNSGSRSSPPHSVPKISVPTGRHP